MHPTTSSQESVAAHYGHQDLETAILTALSAAGKDPDSLRPEDLAPVDEFHIRGRRATQDLARMIRVDETMQVLDVGSGLGGASRFLAQEFGCRVTGLDLTAEYCRVATKLSQLLGLAHLVSYRHGDALCMPFGDASFDVLWSQHTVMNIADKSKLYRETWRVLKPGGVLAIYDILSGEGGPVHYPVPWAREPSISSLISPRQLRNTLEESGFEVLSWRDTTEAGRAWFRQAEEKMRHKPTPPLGLHLLLGPDFRLMAQNQLLNLEEDRITLIEAIARRPATR